jgi:hypothetical protein
MIFNIASWLIYVLIGCRHPSIGYWQHLLESTTATYSLLLPENEHQQRVTEFELHIMRILYSDRLQTSIYQILAAYTVNNYSDMLPAAFS